MSKTLPPILYCGDTTLDTAASYLAGLLAHAGLEFHYVPSDKDLTADLLVENPWSLLILSDYPAPRLPAVLHEPVVQLVRNGAGLLMLGGWESYHGLGGDWDGTAIGNLLPVDIGNKDDRFNCDRPLIVRQRAEHPIVAGLPWKERPPIVGGLNRITPRPEDKVLLTAEEWSMAWNGEKLDMAPTASHPLLVVGERGKGRVAAFASDIAPHWVGPLVDWGQKRVTANGPGAPGIEVGDLYARFFIQLVKWAAGHQA